MNRETRIQISRLESITILGYNIDKSEKRKKCLSKTIEQISITVLMDNSTDLLLKNSTHATRSPLITDGKLLYPLPIAEHGFSALVNIIRNDQNKQENKNNDNNNLFLFDTGVSENGVIHNIGCSWNKF